MNIDQNELIYKNEVYKIQGAVFEVYREIGSVFLESVYQECLIKEFELRSIPFVAEEKLTIKYKGKELQQTYRADFVCYNKIIIELKSSKEVLPVHSAQLINYLKITGLRLGLLVNFGAYPKATVDRFAL